MARQRRRGVSVEAVQFGRLGIDPDTIPDPRTSDVTALDDDAPGWFEGPRLRFSWLIGESPTWAGPWSLRITAADGSIVCRFCGHLAKMPSYAYCLGCDRCGREALLGPLGPLGRRVRGRRAYAPDPSGLRGGVG